MAVITTNHPLVAAPAAQPRRYGLFDAATVTDDLTPHEIGSGFQFAAVDCGVAGLYDSNCVVGENEAKTFAEGLPYMAADPFWVYSARQCGAVGQSPSEFMDATRRALLGSEQTQVEAALWGGTTPAVEPALTTDTGVVTVTPGALGAGAAIAALEAEFYAAYGYLGTIHVNTAAYAAAAYAQLVGRQGGAGVLRTPIGSAWAFGAGYGTDGPEGEAADAGSVWAFMTPQVWVRRSDIIAQDDPRSFMDRTGNQFLGLAERVYAATWTCPVVYAVQIPIAAPAVSVLEVAP